MALLIRRAPLRPTGPLGATVAVAALAAAAPASPARAQSALGEALGLAFPTADTVERRTAYLDEGELARARSLAGARVDVDVSVVTYYVALKGGEPRGVAYFDAHRVRTEPEVLMIVVGTDDRIRRVEVVRWSEPPDYRPPDGWLDLFQGRTLDEGLSVKGDIPRITGATITSGAVTNAARRVLALHGVIRPFDRRDVTGGSRESDAHGDTLQGSGP